MTAPTEAQHRLAPDRRGGRICARPGGAGRAQAGSKANRQEDAGRRDDFGAQEVRQ